MRKSKNLCQAIELIELLLKKLESSSSFDAINGLRDTFDQIFFSNNNLKEIYSDLFPIEQYSLYFDTLDCIRTANIYDVKFVQSYRGKRISKENLIKSLNGILRCLKEGDQHTSFKIFYSWQSNISNKINRNFIEDAIEKAISQIQKEKHIVFTLDKDTIERAGSPDIVSTILEKIKDCYIFISDISLVGNVSSIDNRRMPNPNVMYETGFAQGVCGEENIILVYNLNTGKIEDLPFDVRGKRILTYECDICYNEDQRQKAKKELISKIKNAIIFKFDSDNQQ